MKGLTSILILATLNIAAYEAGYGQEVDKMEIHNGSIKVEVQKIAGKWQETYLVREGKVWKEILVSGSTRRSEPSLQQNGVVVQAGFEKATRSEIEGRQQIIQLTSITPEGEIHKTIVLERGKPYVKTSLSYRVWKTVRLQSLLSTYSFSPEGRQFNDYKPLDWVFTPQLRPDSAHVIADHTFRSPALMVQEKGSFAALVPEVESINVRGRGIRTCGDLQVETAEKPFFSYGLQNWIPEPYRLRDTHVFYTSPDSLAPELTDTTVSVSFLLFLRGDAAEREGFRDVVRYHWAESGSVNIHNPNGPQSEPLSAYIQKAWYQFLPEVALDATYQGKPITLLRQARLAWSNKLHKAADNDSWFNVWFNALRTGYGMYLHGESINDDPLMQRAVNVLNLALLAPQKNGIAPSIFYLDSTGGHWVADHAWGGIDDGRNLAMFHNAWTCYWLLQWVDLVPGRREEILRYTGAFADFLLKNQMESGVIPSWYDPEGVRPVATFRDENAETAGAALFLSDYYKRTKKAEYLRAAERAMDYIFTSIMPERKWFDFETFFSCSRKPIGFFDSFTQQHPQNTLSMHQAAEACYELYALTRNEVYRARGVQIMDYLCLYQQVWSPKWLSCELFGGFGVQNTDAEWSDSRQGYFAVTLMKYYELTGQREYFERGVAALRAMFSLFESPTSPRTAENYAHSGFDQPAGVTGLHWGTGSSVVSIHLITRRYGDAYVDMKGGWGVGIDGCRIPAVSIGNSEIGVTILDNIASPRTITLKFGNTSGGQFYVRVNGKQLGQFPSNELEKGLHVAL